MREQNAALHSEKDLENYFQRFVKRADRKQVGLEAEFFGVSKTTGKALPYQGPGGIQDVLKVLAARFEYKQTLENGNIIGLSREDSAVSLEPGGQVELSAPPVHNVFEIREQVKKFLAELKEASAGFPDIAWLAAGIQPFSTLDEISWVPKQRYDIMREYLGEHGRLSHHMMKRTATNQVNVDYTSEDDAMCMLRTALGITSIVTALFANSSFSEGKPNGYMTFRAEIWRHTDPARTGLIPQFIQPGRKFSDYLNYVLDIPLIFIVRSGKWTALKDCTFRKFLKEGYSGARATLGDFELHLSTIFPEVRLKQYMEVRGVDCQSPDLIPAVAAFWKGILYDVETRNKAWALVADASEQERLQLHADVPKLGLKAKLGGRPIFPTAAKLVELSCASLGRQTDEASPSECVFLDAIRDKIIRPGQSPAETLLGKWEGALGRSPRKLIEYLSV